MKIGKNAKKLTGKNVPVLAENGVAWLENFQRKQCAIPWNFRLKSLIFALKREKLAKFLLVFLKFKRVISQT